jgi:hypothetical protein
MTFGDPAAIEVERSQSDTITAVLKGRRSLSSDLDFRNAAKAVNQKAPSRAGKGASRNSVINRRR